MTIHY